LPADVADLPEQEAPIGSGPPVVQHERIAELLDALVMARVARNQFQAVRKSNGGDHRVGPADGATGAFQLAFDAAGEFGGGLVEGGTSRAERLARKA
jgi:hypothetical protein